MLQAVLPGEDKTFNPSLGQRLGAAITYAIFASAGLLANALVAWAFIVNRKVCMLDPVYPSFFF
jgi:hypothetical protein